MNTLQQAGQIGEVAHFEKTADTWNELLLQIDHLLIEDHKYKTFVQDTFNGAERLAVEHVIQTEFDGKIEKYDAYGRGIKYLIPQILILMKKLEDLRNHKNMSIILIAHSQVKAFQNPAGPNYDRWEPVLEKQTWAMIDRWVDLILFGDFETYTDKAKNETKAKATGGTSRIIHTERQAAFDAGNRMGLPAAIECGNSAKEAWTNFINEIKIIKGAK